MSALAALPDQIQGLHGSYTAASRPVKDDEVADKFGHLIASAVRAFGSDLGYVTDMAAHSSLIDYKRKLWSVRSEVQEQEKRAVERCSNASHSEAFVCENRAACGWGTCLYAEMEHRVQVPTPGPAKKKKLHQRPIPSTHMVYVIEDTITAVLQSRGIRAPITIEAGRQRRLS